MDYAVDPIPEYTVRHLDYGITARRPVKVWSLLYGRPKYRVLHHGLQRDHPGSCWGPVQHLTAEWNHVGLHDHDYCEITLVRGGSAEHRTGCYTAPLHQGDVVVANPGHVHSLDAIDALVETHLAFLPGLLGDDLPAYWSEPALVPLFLGASVFPNPLYPEVPHFALLPDEREAIDSELTVINGELEQAEPSRIYLKVALLKCLVLMARAFVRQWPEGPHVPFRHEVRKAMGLVENAVRAGGAVSIADLAARVSLSHKRFDTVFKESTGLSPTEYVMRRRVQWAARLLLAPDAHITEVALQCGYADAAHFSNTFRRYFGMSPRKYRRQYQAEPGRSDGGTPPPPARPR